VFGNRELRRIFGPKRQEAFGRPRHRWEDNITVDLRETGWEDVDWMNLA
jgi:hypothetical protein